MRKSIFNRLLGPIALCFAGPLMAAGPLDGIYQFGTSEEWLSVHQTGDHVIVGRFFKMSGGESWVTLRNGQEYHSSTAGRWYLMSGDLVAGSKTLIFSGESNLGACISTYRIDFAAAELWVQWIAETTTPAGAAQGIDCQGNYNVSTANGTYRRITKIY